MTRSDVDGALVWFRRDLRDEDHASLARALRESRRVFCAFVFDREILDALPSRDDRRVEFIHGSVRALDAALRARGGGLIVRHGLARSEIPQLARELGVRAVYANRDYEPAARARDEHVAHALARDGIGFVTAKDQVVFEPGEIVSATGKPYSVFTPFKRAWLAALTPAHLQPHATGSGEGRLARPPRGEAIPSLASLGFLPTNLASLGIVPGAAGANRLFADFGKRIERYHEMRDYPARKGPSYLSVHVRFGTISVRSLAAFAHDRSLRAGGEGAATWLSELIWREFYAQILWHHPAVAAGRAFKPQYDSIAFPGGPERLAAWRDGRTGFPFIDAGMRQLAATGYMHNRLRMVTASFLVKDLLVDWREGERHFARLLIDYDLASNNGGWQWAASTGCDAQPWFRVFNPVTQSRRFDPEGRFIRCYVPEIAALGDDEIHAPWAVPPAIQHAKGVVVGRDYPPPIVDHAASREQALALFGEAR